MAAINCMVGLLIVEASGVFTPRQRKMRSSARQCGRKGELFNCKGVAVASDWVAGEGETGMKAGAAMILICLLGALVAGLKYECRLPENL